jgi:hypothetical protein
MPVGERMTRATPVEDVFATATNWPPPNTIDRQPDIVADWYVVHVMPSVENFTPVNEVDATATKAPLPNATSRHVEVVLDVRPVHVWPSAEVATL